MDARITVLFGDAVSLLTDRNVTLVEHGPFHWLETDAVLTFDVRALFLDDARTSWIAKERNLDTFTWLLQRVRPSLSDWQPIVKTHSALTFDDALLTQDAVDDLGDPRWYLMPRSEEQLRQWHAPRVDADGSELVWFVHRFPHQAWMQRLIVRLRADATTTHYDVVVENLA